MISPKFCYIVNAKYVFVWWDIAKKENCQDRIGKKGKTAC